MDKGVLLLPRNHILKGETTSKPGREISDLSAVILIKIDHLISNSHYGKLGPSDIVYSP